MSKIATYSLADTPLQLSDRLIGTEAPRPTPSATPLATKNFSLGELLNLFSSNFPAATLQAVLNAGNTATQNITLTGTIDTTLIRPDNIEDTSGSQGTVFQFLSKGASSINWVDLPVDNLQAVLNAGNTATQSITLIGNITSTRIIPGNIQDDTTGIGTTGQFLSKTASGIRWVNAPASTTPGLGDVLSVGNTAINNINLTGNVTATSFIKTGGTNLQYLMADGSVTTGGGIQTLQQVTDAGNTTTNAISVAGITSGNLYSDGYTFGISDNFDTTYNLYYLPYSGLQITDSINYIYLYQDASIGFQNALGSGNLRSDLVTGLKTWQFPDASGTLALTSNIGTWGALNYPTWTTGTPFVKMTAAGTFALDTTSYYPYPTGTISQYIRGDGTLATFPSVATPTLQQVTTAGNTTTDSIFLQSGLSPNSVILSNGYISLFNNITNRQITISTSDDISFSDGGGNNLYLKSPATITATNTQTLQNASGTIALLSDIPTGGGIPHATAAGTDTYTATVTGVTAYNDADAYLIRFTNGNTTSATLNINSLGAIPLYRNNDGPLIGGDIINGGEMLCVYNSTTSRFQVIGTAPNSLFAYVTNDDSVTLTKGMPVYAFGGTGDRMTVKRANNTGDATSAQTVGLVLSTSIAANQKGLIMMQGLLDGLSILPTATWSDGDAVYLGATPGSITNIKPYAPNHLVYLGVVTTASNGAAGRMYVRVQNGYELQELHNVDALNPNNNDGIFYNSITQLWEHKNVLAVAAERRNANNSTNNSINYCGIAPADSLENASVWIITRLTITLAGAVTTASAINVKWTDRETAIYT